VLDVLRADPRREAGADRKLCCGMAGSFGYEAEHAPTRRCRCRWPSAALLPAIRKQPDAIVVADGTSCRHQIADGAQRHRRCTWRAARIENVGGGLGAASHLCGLLFQQSLGST
jgi:Fe-S oxidoreductase